MTTTRRLRDRKAIGNTIARMQGFLDQGRWPSGVPLTLADRDLIRWNIELARQERAALDARA